MLRAFKLGTPAIRIVSVPAPRILAPMLFRNVAISIISGSRAAFSSIVCPLARTAAKIMLMGAPTDTVSNAIRAPIKPFSVASIWIMSLVSVTVAPSASNPLIC